MVLAALMLLRNALRETLASRLNAALVLALTLDDLIPCDPCVSSQALMGLMTIHLAGVVVAFDAAAVLATRGRHRLRPRTQGRGDSGTDATNQRRDRSDKHRPKLTHRCHMNPITRLLIVALVIAAAPVHALANTDSVVLGMGCFWGAEKRMAAVPGVTDVESGYAGGDAKQAGYRDVLDLEKSIQRGRSDQRNHTEVVKVTFDTDNVSLEQVLIAFWENHDPTQGDRQGNDIGSNYRSAVYTNSASQRVVALKTRSAYQKALSAAGYGRITTEIAPLWHYNRAESYHQDYLVKNPNGYCGLSGTKVAYPGQPEQAKPKALNAAELNRGRQLIVFEAEHCPFCEQFRAEVLDDWSSDVPVVATYTTAPPKGWELDQTLFATPTMVLFENGEEVSRFTGYKGDKARFWKWLGQRTS